MAFLISIPVPPSVNQMYGNRQGRGRGRYKTKAYKDWIEAAGWQIKAQRVTPVDSKYRMFLSLPKIRGDADNRLKGVSDLLVALGLTPDDRHCVEFRALIVPELKDCAVVSVEEA